MTLGDRILAEIQQKPLDDDVLAKRLGASSRQPINIAARKLEQRGLLRRYVGLGGKIVNEPTTGLGLAAAEAERALTDPADSSVQRLAEPAMLAALGADLGLDLKPRRLVHPHGARVEIDGADANLRVLVECWAHQGTAKVAQKYKLVNDAMKLQWAASWLEPTPERLILCVSDELAIKHLRGTSWQGQAIAHAGVELRVVDLDAHLVESIVQAQKRQMR